MDVIFNMYKIRYVDMQNLLTDLKKGSVQIFINLEPVFRRLYRADIESYLKVNYKKRIYEFVSNVLNLAAHYRKFFSNQGRDTEVIMYMPDWKRSYTNGMICKGYRQDNDSKLFDNKTVYARFLKETIELITTIVTYIEGVYLIKSNVLEPSVIPYLFTNHFNNQVLVTTDRYEYQYAAHNFTILRPKKNHESYSINQHNAIDVMKLEDKIISNERISHTFIPLILSFTGDAVRGIPKIKGLGLHKIIKLVNDGIQKGIITDSTTNLSLIENMLVEDIKEQIKQNYYVVDLRLQKLALSKSVMILLASQKEDKFDNVSLKKINQLFIESPIMLNELMPLKQKKNIFES